jgi:hypothetical protein
VSWWQSVLLVLLVLLLSLSSPYCASHWCWGQGEGEGGGVGSSPQWGGRPFRTNRRLLATAMWFVFLAQKITAQPETHLWTCGFLCCVALVT